MLFAKQGDGVPPPFDFHFNVQLQDHADIPEFPDCLTEMVGGCLLPVVVTTVSWKAETYPKRRLRSGKWEGAHRVLV